MDPTIIITTISAITQAIVAYRAFRLLPVAAWQREWRIFCGVFVVIALLKGLQVVIYLLPPSNEPLSPAIEWGHFLFSVTLLLAIRKLQPVFIQTQRSEDLYRLFVENSTQGLAIFQQGHLVFSNHALSYLTGLPPEQIHRMDENRFSQCFHPDDRENVRRLLQANDLESPSVRREVRLLNRRGMTFWLELYVSRVTFTGQPALQLTFINITDRKKVEQALHESEQRHRLISQLTSDFIYAATVHPNNEVQIDWVSGAFERITGFQFEELAALRKSWRSLEHPEDHLKTVEAYTFALSNQPVVIEYRILSKHGEIIWLRDYLQPIWNDEEQRVTQIFGAVQDVTSRKIAETALKDSEARWRGLAENAPIIILTIDPHKHISWMNRPFIKTAGEIIGKDIFALLPPGVRPAFHRAVDTVFSSGKPQRMELELPEPSGVICYEVILGPVRQEGQITSAILVMTDITERKATEEQLKFLSNHDALTGLFNRAFFETELERLQNSRLYTVTIVMIDVNNLKSTNDTYGHAAGDDLLRSIAQVMREAFRSEDIIARIGGDEFAVLLPATGQETAQAILRRLNEKVNAVNATTQGLPISLAIGAATSLAGGRLVDVMKEADNLMYEDKARKKGTGPLRRENTRPPVN